jgi:hypothetical protein
VEELSSQAAQVGVEVGFAVLTQSCVYCCCCCDVLRRPMVMMKVMERVSAAGSGQHLSLRTLGLLASGPWAKVGVCGMGGGGYVHG